MKAYIAAYSCLGVLLVAYVVTGNPILITIGCIPGCILFTKAAIITLMDSFTYMWSTWHTT